MSEQSAVVHEPTAGRRLARALSPTNISALYFLLLMFVIFSFWVPHTFLTLGTWRSLLNDQAVVALVAIGFGIPLAAGAFDLAVGAEVGLTGVLVAWLLAQHSIPMIPAIAVTLVAGALIGSASGLFVVRMRIDSFIATLGMSSILIALTSWLSGGEQILNLSSAFQRISTVSVLGVTASVWLLLVVVVIVCYVMEHTPAGRRIYATGGNREAARLAGVRTGTVIVLSLAACGILTAVAGVLNSSTLGVGDPTVGPAYLLPALAGVFLGSTQFRGGRVNVWGTVTAIYVLAVGTTGLQLAGAPSWIPDLFNGAALLIAVGVARSGLGSGHRMRVVRRAIRMRSTQPAADGILAPDQEEITSDQH
jgi:ribose transport system permease protein